MRTRTCFGGNAGVRGCVGPNVQQKACGLKACPFWSEWTEWGNCNVTCGGGSRYRYRQCINDDFGFGCVGLDFEEAFCGDGVREFNCVIRFHIKYI